MDTREILGEKGFYWAVLGSYLEVFDGLGARCYIIHTLLGALFFAMAKKSQLARYAKKQKLVKKYAVKRAALKLAGDSEGLQKLPKNSSPVRLKNRCAITGRSRGYMRTFGLSRIEFRELARNGKIPGVKKASW